MKKLKDLGIRSDGKWLRNYAIFECPECRRDFEADISDVSRGRRKNCGCKRHTNRLDPFINGVEVSADLGMVNGRRRAVFICPSCAQSFEFVVSDMNSGRFKGHCGCNFKGKQPKERVEIESVVDKICRITGWDKKDVIKLKYNYTSMKQRCTNPNHPKYHRYGGRGIQVCERWSKSFLNFVKDMGMKPSSDLSLDRIDNDGNYEPSNCRWATHKEQQNNKSNNVN